VKYKDFSYPTISIVIGDQLIHRASPNSGANVNLIPFIEYERLGLGELKPTKMVIQLADRLTRLPRDVVGNVLIRVDEYITLWTLLCLKLRRWSTSVVKSL